MTTVKENITTVSKRSGLEKVLIAKYMRKNAVTQCKATEPDIVERRVARVQLNDTASIVARLQS